MRDCQRRQRRRQNHFVADFGRTAAAGIGRRMAILRPPANAANLRNLRRVIAASNAAYFFRRGCRQHRLACNGDRRRTAEAMEWAGLSSLAADTAATLSGGMRQRLSLARMRAARPKLCLLTSPKRTWTKAAAAWSPTCRRRPLPKCRRPNRRPADGRPRHSQRNPPPTDSGRYCPLRKLNKRCFPPPPFYL